VSAPTLRPYQTRAVEAIAEARSRGVKRLILVAPTGAGKTEIASALFAANLPAPGLFLVHRLELVEQAAERFRRHGIHVGVIQGDTPPDPSAPVQVASIQTLARRAHPEASLVITDESHHAVAGTFTDVIEAYPEAFHVGVTATPYRLDGRGLGTLFEEILVAAYPHELVELGYLVRPRIYTAPPPDLSGIRKVAGDYSQGQLSERMTSLTGNVVETWRKLADNRKTVAFAVDIAHSKALVERFLEAGIAAEHFDGGDDRDTRRAVLDRFRSGETTVLSNCSLISEGFDLPEIGVVQMARPTASRALYKQQVGRAMRPAEGKVDCILLDNAGNFSRFGDPLDVEEYSLTDEVKVPRPLPVKTCKQCFAVIPAASPTCPYCGYAPPAQVTRVTESEDELVEASSLVSRYQRMGEDERVDLYAGLVKQAEGCGYRIGWAAWQYKNRFGEWPPDFVKARVEVRGSEPQEALRRWVVEAGSKGYKQGWAKWRYKNAFGKWPSASAMARAEGGR
jgi:superfamily II DNA or RNA helicase